MVDLLDGWEARYIRMKINMRMGTIGFSLFVGGGLAYVLDLSPYFGLGFSLIIFILRSRNGNLKKEEDGEGK